MVPVSASGLHRGGHPCRLTVIPNVAQPSLAAGRLEACATQQGGIGCGLEGRFAGRRPVLPRRPGDAPVLQAVLPNALTRGGGPHSRFLSMRLLRYRSRTFRSQLAAFCRAAAPARELQETVAAILADVRERGDAAVVDQAARIDGARLTPRGFRVTPADLAGAAAALSSSDRAAFLAARANVRAFNRRTLLRGWSGRNRQGARVGEKYDPIRRIG